MNKIIKVIILSLGLTMSSFSVAGVHEDHPYTYTISKDAYKLADFYQIKSIAKET